MTHRPAHLWCVGLLVLGCGDDAPSTASESSSTSSSIEASSSEPTASSEDPSLDSTSGDIGTGDLDSSSSGAESSSSLGSEPACGDGVIEGDELCDGLELAGETCISQGFDGGELACSAGCDRFDTQDCWTVVCGDGMAQGRELCDGNDLAEGSCVSEGFDSGTLACNPDCTYDASGCGTCGNVIVDGDEVCDDVALLGQTCITQGFDSGALACASDCLTYDASGCGTCGNDLVDGAESCDGLNLGGEGCLTQGFDSGTLACAPDCLFDTGGCGTCGNDVVDGDELCDGVDLGSEACATQGFDSGALACTVDCAAYDTIGCGTCGNGLVDGAEDCDGMDLDGESCASLGAVSGTLGCTPGCQFDLSTCDITPVTTLLITQGATLQERELDGTLISSTAVPLMGGTENELRELTHTNGVTYVYRGTFSPTLTYYDTSIPDWVHLPYAGWSTVNNVSYGGLAHTEDWIWATDMNTAGAPEIGLVRFSLLGLPTERVMDTQAYIDVFAGHDGLVYGLRSNQDTVDVVDPVTGAQLNVITLATDVRAVAVAADGTILGASWDSNLYSYDALGGLLVTLGAGVGSLVDVDLASDGTIAVGGRFGEVVIIDAGLGGVTGTFDAGADETFLEFYEFP